MNLKNISATTSYTIKGNDDTTNALASIAEVQIKRIIFDNLEMLGLRADMTSNSLIRVGALGTAIYRIGVRGVIGTDYDYNKGVQRQRTKALDTPVQIDQHLTAEFMFEQFDIERFRDANPAVRAELMSDWLESITQSYLMSLEAIFIRGVMDSTIAYANKRPQNIITADPDAITDEKSARDFYVKIKTIVNQWGQLISDTAIGVSQDKIKIALSPAMMLKLTAYLPDFILNDTTFKVLATGRLASTSIMGTPVREHKLLNNKMTAGTPSQINKDLSFDFTNLHMVMYIEDAMCMPIGVEIAEMIKDNFTLNPKYITKNMGSLPVNLRPDYVLIGMSKMPTQDDVKKAQGQLYDATSTDYTKSFQQAAYDKDFGTAPTTDGGKTTGGNTSSK